MVTLILSSPQCIHRSIITMTCQGREVKLKWVGYHLAPNKFKDHAKTKHELISFLNPLQHPNYLTYFPSRDNYK